MEIKDFIPGVWYNSNINRYFFKFLRCENRHIETVIFYSERVSGGVYEDKQHWLSNPDYYENATVATSEEIDRYLPYKLNGGEVNNTYKLY